jgi:hypothetical protein
MIDKENIQPIVANAQALHNELEGLLNDMEQEDFWTAPYEGEQDKYS